MAQHEPQYHGPALGAPTKAKMGRPVKNGFSPEERQARSIVLWLKGKLKSEVKDALCLEFGIARGTADRDFNLARAAYSEADQAETKEQKRSWVEGALKRAVVKPMEPAQLLALKQYAKLLGLEQRADEDGPPPDVRIEMPDWRRSVVEALEDGHLESASNNGNGKKPSNGTKPTNGNGTGGQG